MARVHRGFLGRLQPFARQRASRMHGPVAALEARIFLGGQHHQVVPPLLGDRHRLAQRLVAECAEGFLELAGGDAGQGQGGPWVVCLVLITPNPQIMQIPDFVDYSTACDMSAIAL